jgi:hypothetical protein
MGVVAEVEEILLGQRDQALVQNREPADARVQDGDREVWGGGRQLLSAVTA